MSDLLVIGPGRLGMLVAQNWQKSAENCKIFLKFRSANDERKERLTKEGFTVLSEEEETPVCKRHRETSAIKMVNPNL